jgi:hypothetical protein
LVGATLRHILGNPFFLLSLAGVGLAPAAVCLGRRVRPSPSRLLSRRRCRLGVPPGLIFSSVLLIPVFGGAGAPFVMAHPGAAAAVAGTVLAVTTLYIFIPWWGRLLVLALLIVLFLPAGVLWSPEVGPGLSPFRQPELQVQHLESTGEGDVSVPGSGVNGGYAVAMVRLGTAASDPLEVTVVPTTGGLNRVSADIQPLGRGAWLAAGTVSSRAYLEVTVDVLVVTPLLWWLPPAGTPLSLQIDGQPVLQRFPDGSFRKWLLERLVQHRIVSVQSLDVQLPGPAATFLQPGTYVVEIRPGSLI